MTRRASSRLPASALLVCCCAALAGCEPPDIRVAASHLPPYQKPIDRPKNIIDTALDHCPDKTEEREAVCVKKALADAHTSVEALVAMVPGCRMGRTCVYQYTTEDRLGYLPIMAEDFTAHWKVSFDLKHAAKTVADIPITVQAV